MEKRYPSASAEVWDAVGLVTGRPEASISKVLFAVDPSEVVVEEAKALGAELIITHHPLILLSEENPEPTKRKTKIIADLLAADIGLFTAHTNADVAKPGVSDALATAIGIEVDSAIDQIVGLGRIGKLPRPMMLSDFAAQVVDGLPATKRAVHVAGDLTRAIKTVAVCGGSGSSLLELVGLSDVDVYVTSDLKYHVAEEFVNTTGKALIDISHWAGEWTWLNLAAELLVSDLGGTLEAHVSSIVTDPWSLSI